MMQENRMFPIHDYVKKAGGDSLSDADFNLCMTMLVLSVKNVYSIYHSFEALSTDLFRIYGKSYNYFIQDLLRRDDISIFDEEYFDLFIKDRYRCYPDYRFMRGIHSLELVPGTVRVDTVTAFMSILMSEPDNVKTILDGLSQMTRELVEYGLMYMATGINLSMLYQDQGYLAMTIQRIQNTPVNSATTTLATSGDGTSPDDWAGLFESDFEGDD
jgi:hypothetical protein